MGAETGAGTEGVADRSGPGRVRTIRVLLGICALTLASACAQTSGTGAVSAPAAVGVPVPAFTASRMDGATFTEADLGGRPALVLFWSAECPRCRALLPGIDRVRRRYGGAGLQVLAIGDGRRASMEARVAEQAPGLPMAVDDGSAAAAFGVTAMPTWFFLDAAGLVRHRSTSFDPDDPLLDLIAAELVGIDAEDCATALC